MSRLLFNIVDSSRVSAFLSNPFLCSEKIALHRKGLSNFLNKYLYSKSTKMNKIIGAYFMLQKIIYNDDIFLLNMCYVISTNETKPINIYGFARFLESIINIIFNLKLAIIKFLKVRHHYFFHFG